MKGFARGAPRIVQGGDVMFHRSLRIAVTVALTLASWAVAAREAQAQYAPDVSTASPSRSLNRFWYYPYYYFPANYWPSMGPKYPEPIGAPYQRPPAYMAYPPFREPSWRYEYCEPQKYYRGFHFWLDQF